MAVLTDKQEAAGILRNSDFSNFLLLFDFVLVRCNVAYFLRGAT